MFPCYFAELETLCETLCFAVHYCIQPCSHRSILQSCWFASRYPYHAAVWFPKPYFAVNGFQLCAVGAVAQKRKLNSWKFDAAALVQCCTRLSCWHCLHIGLLRRARSMHLSAVRPAASGLLLWTRVVHGLGWPMGWVGLGRVHYSKSTKKLKGLRYCI